MGLRTWPTWSSAITCCLSGHVLSRIYAKAAEEFGQACSLIEAEVRCSSLSSTRNIVDVIFSDTNRNTDFTEKFLVRCDVDRGVSLPGHQDVALL